MNDNNFSTIIEFMNSKGIFPWTYIQDQYCLYKLSSLLKNNSNILEIGTYEAGTSCLMALSSKDDCKVYTIDPYLQKRNRNSWQKLLKANMNISNIGMHNKIFRCVSKSHYAYEVLNVKIDLLFIDGNHRYQDVKKDWELWRNKISDNGIVAFHDTNRKYITMPDYVPDFIENEISKEFKVYNNHNYDGSLSWIFFGNEYDINLPHNLNDIGHNQYFLKKKNDVELKKMNYSFLKL